MKKSLLICFLLAIAAFAIIYYKYKTKRLERIIGISEKNLLESIYTTSYELDTIDISEIEDNIKKLIYLEKRPLSKPVLKYTLKGKVRQQVYWLIYKENGYYVIEAEDKNL